MKHRAGFTILEMMVAVSILAVSATILLGTQSTAMHMNAYSSDISIAALLARAQMQDLEYEILQEPFKEGSDEEFSGDFSKQGYDSVKWEARVEPIEIGDDAANSFVAAMESQLFGGEDSDGTLNQANMSIGDAVPILITLLPKMINDLGMKMRRVTLTLNWEYLGEAQTLTVSQYVVQLSPPLVIDPNADPDDPPIEEDP